MFTENELYDQRQYKLMLEIFNKYKKKQVTLKYVISSIQSLVNCLHMVDFEYQQKINDICDELDYDDLNINDSLFPLERKTQLLKDREQYLNELYSLIIPKVLFE